MAAGFSLGGGGKRQAQGSGEANGGREFGLERTGDGAGVGFGIGPKILFHFSSGSVLVLNFIS
jgi:hypothetical protein